MAAQRDAGAEAFWVGAAALALAISGLIALPLWGRALDRYDPARVLVFATAAAALTHVPLLFLQTPLQLVLARAAFGLSAAAMQPAIVRLIKEYAPAGHGRARHLLRHLVPLHRDGPGALLRGPHRPGCGLRAYFALTIVLTVVGIAAVVAQRARGVIAMDAPSTPL